MRNGTGPALLADAFVSSLRDAIELKDARPEAVMEPFQYGPGGEVVVLEGALKGVCGIVRERRSGRQLVIWVAEIGRGVALTIGAALVKATG